MTERDLPPSIAANVAEWTETNAQFTDAQAEEAWQPQDLTWGVFARRSPSVTAGGRDRPRRRELG